MSAPKKAERSLWLGPDGWSVEIIDQTRNDAFDVTPARFVTGFITERGVCGASAAGLKQLFPDASTNL
jgi:methylthioribose-1-phosphate isomerase